MYEHEQQEQGRRAFPADENDARAQARRALQDAYDWRDDEPRAAAARPVPASPSTPQDERSARAAARRSRRQSVRSISRTVGV